MVLPCNCAHDYQDKVYGKNQRVHTPAAKGHRCTICGAMKNYSQADAKKK